MASESLEVNVSKNGLELHATPMQLPLRCRDCGYKTNLCLCEEEDNPNPKSNTDTYHGQGEENPNTDNFHGQRLQPFSIFKLDMLARSAGQPKSSLLKPHSRDGKNIAQNDLLSLHRVSTERTSPSWNPIGETVHVGSPRKTANYISSPLKTLDMNSPLKKHSVSSLKRGNTMARSLFKNNDQPGKVHGLNEENFGGRIGLDTRPKTAPGITAEGCSSFTNVDPPGNVRELNERNPGGRIGLETKTGGETLQGGKSLSNRRENSSVMQFAMPGSVLGPPDSPSKSPLKKQPKVAVFNEQKDRRIQGVVGESGSPRRMTADGRSPRRSLRDLRSPRKQASPMRVIRSPLRKPFGLLNWAVDRQHVISPITSINSIRGEHQVSSQSKQQQDTSVNAEDVPTKPALQETSCSRQTERLLAEPSFTSSEFHVSPRDRSLNVSVEREEVQDQNNDNSDNSQPVEGNEPGRYDDQTAPSHSERPHSISSAEEETRDSDQFQHQAQSEGNQPSHNDSGTSGLDAGLARDNENENLSSALPKQSSLQLCPRRSIWRPFDHNSPSKTDTTSDSQTVTFDRRQTIEASDDRRQTIEAIDDRRQNIEAIDDRRQTIEASDSDSQAYDRRTPSYSASSSNCEQVKASVWPVPLVTDYPEPTAAVSSSLGLSYSTWEAHAVLNGFGSQLSYSGVHAYSDHTHLASSVQPWNPTQSAFRLQSRINPSSLSQRSATLFDSFARPLERHASSYQGQSATSPGWQEERHQGSDTGHSTQQKSPCSSPTSRRKQSCVVQQPIPLRGVWALAACGERTSQQVVGLSEDQLYCTVRDESVNYTVRDHSPSPSNNTTPAHAKSLRPCSRDQSSCPSNAPTPAHTKLPQSLRPSKNKTGLPKYYTVNCTERDQTSSPSNTLTPAHTKPTQSLRPSKNKIGLPKDYTVNCTERDQTSSPSNTPTPAHTKPPQQLRPSKKKPAHLLSTPPVAVESIQHRLTPSIHLQSGQRTVLSDISNVQSSQTPVDLSKSSHAPVDLSVRAVDLSRCVRESTLQRQATSTLQRQATSTLQKQVTLQKEFTSHTDLAEISQYRLTPDNTSERNCDSPSYVSDSRQRLSPYLGDPRGRHHSRHPSDSLRHPSPHSSDSYHHSPHVIDTRHYSYQHVSDKQCQPSPHFSDTGSQPSPHLRRHASPHPSETRRHPSHFSDDRRDTSAHFHDSRRQSSPHLSDSVRHPSHFSDHRRDPSPHVSDNRRHSSPHSSGNRRYPSPHLSDHRPHPSPHLNDYRYQPSPHCSDSTRTSSPRLSDSQRMTSTPQLRNNRCQSTPHCSDTQRPYPHNVTHTHNGPHVTLTHIENRRDPSSHATHSHTHSNRNSPDTVFDQGDFRVVGMQVSYDPGTLAAPNWNLGRLAALGASTTESYDPGTSVAPNWNMRHLEAAESNEPLTSVAPNWNLGRLEAMAALGAAGILPVAGSLPCDSPATAPDTAQNKDRLQEQGAPSSIRTGDETRPESTDDAKEEEKKRKRRPTELVLYPDECVQHWEQMSRDYAERNKEMVKKRGTGQVKSFKINKLALDCVEKYKMECPGRPLHLLCQGIVLLDPFAPERDMTTVTKHPENRPEARYSVVLDKGTPKEETRYYRTIRDVDKAIDRRILKHICVFCPDKRKGGDSFDMTRHMRIHRVTFPYKCMVPGCKGSEHGQLVSLEQHIKGQHSSYWHRIEPLKQLLLAKSRTKRPKAKKKQQEGQQEHSQEQWQQQQHQKQHQGDSNSKNTDIIINNKEDNNDDDEGDIDDLISLIPEDLRWFSFPGIKDHICELCGILFRKADEYISHLQLFHQDHPHLLVKNDRRTFPSRPQDENVK